MGSNSVPLDLLIKEEDFVHHANNQETQFDDLLQKTWTLAGEKSVFRYSIQKGSTQSKLMPGQFGLVAQLNPERGLLRRKPLTMDSISMPFDDNRFNFTKIKPEEILFNINIRRETHLADDINEPTATIIVNNSPFEYCSSLMVPQLTAKLPQVLTASSVTHAISLCCLSSSPYFRMGFNSLGAAASVNHLHWHLYYFEFDLILEGVPIKDGLVTDWPITGIVYELKQFTTPAIEAIAQQVESLADKCMALDLAYNLFITRSKDRKSIRIFFWPREAVFGAKEDLAINPALCEFSGFFICKTKETFENINEDYCVKLIKAVAPSESQIQNLFSF